jgi:signal transduction histidine kinase
MLLMMSLASDLPRRDLLLCVAADVAMMVTGGLATWCGRTLAGLAWGAVSTVTFVPVIVGIRRMLLSAEREAAGGEEQVAAGALRVLRHLAVATWLAFPVVWLLAYLGIVGPLVEQSMWAACDFGAKAIFSSHLWQANLLSVQQRRDQARERFETSARALAADRLRALLAERGWLVEALTCDLRSNVNGLLALLAQLSACEASAPPPGAAAAAVAAAAAAAVPSGSNAANGKSGGGKSGGERPGKKQRRPKSSSRSGPAEEADGDDKDGQNGGGGDGAQAAAADDDGGSSSSATTGGATDTFADDASASVAAAAAQQSDVVAAAAAAAAADARSRERRARLIATLRSSAGMLLNSINTTLDSAAAQTGALRLERRAVPLWRSAEGVARLTRPLLAEGAALVNAIPSGGEGGGGEAAGAAAGAAAALDAAAAAAAGGSSPSQTPPPPHEAWALWRRASPADARPPPPTPTPPAAQSSPALEVLADPTRLIQVFFSLTGTAARWTPAGGRIVLSAEVLPGGREVRVSVADTGVGIPRERLDAVFGDGSSGGGGGGGGGGEEEDDEAAAAAARPAPADDRGGANALLLVRNCLAAMGSTLVVQSAEGRGTRASFVLPLAPPPGGFAPLPAAAAAAAPAPAAAGAGGGKQAAVAATLRQRRAGGGGGGGGGANGSGGHGHGNGAASLGAPAAAPAAPAAAAGGDAATAPDVQALWDVVQALRDEVASLKKR